MPVVTIITLKGEAFYIDNPIDTYDSLLNTHPFSNFPDYHLISHNETNSSLTIINDKNHKIDASDNIKYYFAHGIDKVRTYLKSQVYKKKTAHEDEYHFSSFNTDSSISDISTEPGNQQPSYKIILARISAAGARIKSYLSSLWSWIRGKVGNLGIGSSVMQPDPANFNESSKLLKVSSTESSNKNKESTKNIDGNNPKMPIY